MPEKILIVDDDADTVEFLKVLLKKQGFETVTAKDGLEALTQAHQEEPDLIVLDIMMPGMDGYEVARSLHRHPDTALIPILMFTARTQVADKIAGYEAGVDLYLTKPVHPMDLQANIKALLLQRKARKVALMERGYQVGVLASKGGLGVSTVALNLAIASAHQQKVKTIAAELRPGQGTWADELGIDSKGGLNHLLKINTSEITQSVVEDQLVDTPFGVRVLLSGSDNFEVEMAAVISQYDAVISQLGMLAPLVVLDIGTPFFAAFPVILELCDELVLVVEPQPLSVKRAARTMEALRAKGFGNLKPITVVTVNHTRSDSILTISQVEAELNHHVALGFPPSLELAATAIQEHLPMCVLRPESLISLQFYKLAEVIKAHSNAK